MTRLAVQGALDGKFVGWLEPEQYLTGPKE